MGYGCNILKAYHIMIGCDFHDTVPPVVPLPPPVVTPHICVDLLIGINLTSKYGSSVVTHSNFTMQRGTDIGPLIPHIPTSPNVLIAGIWLLSGSKSEFGASSVDVEGKPAAIAVGKIVNFNLNCSGPIKRPPFPTGLVITFNTVEANVTAGDLLAGAAAMVVDALVEWGINLIFHGIGKVFAGPLQTAYSKLFLNNRVGDWLFGRFGQYAVEGIEFGLPLIIGSTLTGSPLGYAPDWSPGGGFLGRQIDRGHDALRSYIDNNSVEEHPSRPPDAGAGGGSPDAGVGDSVPDAGAGGGSPDAGVGDSVPDAGT